MEQDLNLLTEDEAGALEAPPNEDEPETTSEEIKVETEEPSPPVEEPPKETPPPEGTPKAEAKPEDTQVHIDGVLTKDGKNVIPFSVLEQERAKRQELEAKLAEATKPKEPPPAEVPPPPPKAATPADIAKELGIDFKVLSEKAYESQEGMAEVLATVLQAGIQIAQKEGQGAGTKGAASILYEKEVAQIKKDNPWLKDEAEEVCFTIAQKEIRNNPNFNPENVGDWLDATKNAIAKTKALLKIDQKPFDAEAERKRLTEEVTTQLMQKFNIKPSKVTTLAGIRNVSPDLTTKIEHVASLNGLDFEEAYGKLTSSERDAYDNKYLR